MSAVGKEKGRPSWKVGKYRHHEERLTPESVSKQLLPLTTSLSQDLPLQGELSLNLYLSPRVADSFREAEAGCPN